MKTTDFSYTLPEELIAHRPLENRDTSRLLVLDRSSGEKLHKNFYDLIDYIHPGDRIVFNNTRVIPGRIFVKKENGVRIELLFTKEVSSHKWEVIAKPAKRLKVGTEVFLEKESSIKLTVDSVLENGSRVLKSEGEPIVSILERNGEMPIPPYMERRADEADRTTYQTVFAEKKGAVAAPTAGLHFTDSLMEKLKAKGVEFSFVTLHVGIGTFRPVKVENPLEHPMHSEEYEVTESCAAEISATKKSGGRIFAIGTTVVRTLEHSAAATGEVVAGRGDTDIFIFPSFKFNCVDSLVTNFHLPESTLMMLVSALYNREEILAGYEEAIKERYRFFSYGDAMLIL